MKPTPVILIVEDEALVRFVEADTALEGGLDPVEARDAEEAIRILEGRVDIRAVLIDIQLPGEMDGLELARLVRERWSNVEVILTSGRWRPDDLPAGARFLAKPFAADEIADVLASVAKPWSSD